MLAFVKGPKWGEENATQTVMGKSVSFYVYRTGGLVLGLVIRAFDP